MNKKTKVAILIFFIFTFLYFVDKFFDNFTFVSPIKSIRLQLPVQRRISKKISRNKFTETKIKVKKTTAHKGIDVSHVSDQSGLPLIPTRHGMAGGSDAEKAIYVYFGKDKIARAVASAESGLDCKKINVNSNGTKDYGLFQINEVHKKRFTNLNPLDCWHNAKVAEQLQREQGWGIWVAFINHSYKKFL